MGGAIKKGPINGPKIVGYRAQLAAAELSSLGKNKEIGKWFELKNLY